jgi:hypothetical protein
MKKQFVILCGLFPMLLVQIAVASDSPRAALELAGSGWRAWMDSQAAWANDAVVAPGDVNLTKLPVNPPTGGWQVLNDSAGRSCSIPASVEELFSGGDHRWTYHGVTWLWRTVKVPAEWKGKVVRLGLAKANRRIEMLINQRLAGYDAVGEVPVEADVSKFLNYGAENQIAIRITNPGGNRGWEDFKWVRWGNMQLPPGHDFGGVDGPVTLTATDPVFIEDIFVKNLLPAGERRAEVQVTIANQLGGAVPLAVTVVIYADGVGKPLHQATWKVTAERGAKNTSACAIAVPNAQLWDLNTPVLYRCTVGIQGPGVVDRHSVTFGFRTAELKNDGGKNELFFNGKRMRHRSAIDWGYYAVTGFYATPDMAGRSVANARAIGHNGINFHRRIGEPRVLDAADRQGLYLYEEPGGFHIGGECVIEDGTLAGRMIEEKVRRMVLRDRNHPSLFMYSLSNENSFWSPLRERVMRNVAALDPTRLVINTSGGNGYASMDQIPHIRPYEKEIRKDYRDAHTVQSTGLFAENDWAGHASEAKGPALYWGEVRCHTGPADWISTAALYKGSTNGDLGYGLSLYKPMADELAAYFAAHRPDQTGSRSIHSPSDISRAAGRGLMYKNGRLCQSMMKYDGNIGFAINGWSGGPQLPDQWDSAICDEGRFLKGPSADYAYWTRDCQIAIQRGNGKYFKPGDVAQFNLTLINEGHIAAGPAVLDLTVTDGAGKPTAFHQQLPVKVAGGTTFAQDISQVNVPLDAAWCGGYITVRGVLKQGVKTLADGSEQVLLQNRPSFKAALAPFAGAVCAWPMAQTALDEAGGKVPAYADSLGKLDYVLAGQRPDAATVARLLERVSTQGMRLIIRFDKDWAEELHKRGVLSKPVTQWGGKQADGWNGNGWGYLEYFVGDQAVPSGPVIGSNGWQVPSDPIGFAPFESAKRTATYGVYVARADYNENNGSLLTLLAAVQWGKGSIILAPSYPVDQNNPFNDLVFYNMITMKNDNY